MDIKRKLVATGVAVLALGGIGGGTAIAQSSGDPSTPAQQEQPGVDQDTTDFTPANEQGKPEPADNEASEAQEGPEKAEAPEADGTVHEDPDGVDVEYTPAGEQPEPEPAAKG